MVISRSFGTHDGTFHADEVTACALLIVYDLIDFDKVIRTRSAEKLADCEFVCDVGGEYNPDMKRFDHHQISYKGDFSSAGMIWLYLRDIKKIDKPTYVFLNRSLMQGIDAHDNGRGHLEPGVCTFSHVISNFVPIHYDVSPEEQDVAFKEALTFVIAHLKRALQRFHFTEQCREKVALAMQEKKEVIYFEEAMPWLDAFFDMGGESHPAQFVIMPSGGRWKLRGIPPTTEERMKVRRPLPLEWAGLLEEDLKKVSGIPGAVFCHKGRFISVWETKDDALKALKYTLSRERV